MSGSTSAKPASERDAYWGRCLDCAHTIPESAGELRFNDKMTATKVRMAQAGLANRDTNVAQLREELKITRHILYRFVSQHGELRSDAIKLPGQRD